MHALVARRRPVGAIAAVEGVDIVFAGPADLSASLGVIGQFDHPELKKFLADFPARVAAHGKPAGITFASLDRCREAFTDGYRFINIGTVTLHGIAGLTTALQDMRDLESSPT